MNANVCDKNFEFWDELCGSQAAKHLGVVDNSKESLEKFDNWFFSYYPYLEKYIPFSDFEGQKILEVGLGYGSVAQKIAESGADYYALDIATGPVSMVRHRLDQNGLSGGVHQGSILEAPFKDEEFDGVVAIGCFHHTGNTQQALDETWRMLKPGGKAVVMVYNAYSYRRWLRSFFATWKYYRQSSFDNLALFEAIEHERSLYDVNVNGDAAPHTDFFSARHIEHMARKWKKVSVYSENVGDESFLKYIPRKVKNSSIGRFAGLDIYCILNK